MGSSAKTRPLQLTVCYWKLPFIVDLPINSMVIFHSYVKLPAGITMINGHATGTDWLEVPIPLYKAYFLGLNFRGYPHNSSYGPKYGTFTYLHLLDPEDLPLKFCWVQLDCRSLEKTKQQSHGAFFDKTVPSWCLKGNIQCKAGPGPDGALIGQVSPDAFARDPFLNFNGYPLVN